MIEFYKLFLLYTNAAHKFPVYGTIKCYCILLYCIFVFVTIYWIEQFMECDCVLCLIIIIFFFLIFQVEHDTNSTCCKMRVFFQLNWRKESEMP